MQICFDELRRAQEVSPRPNFLVLLGDRYGWQPLAETISEGEFQALEAAAGELDADATHEAQAGGSATEALRTWYRRDDNAVPVEYQLRSRNDWPGLPEWTEQDEEQAWKKVEQTLWTVINRAYPQEGLAGRFGQIPVADEPLPSIVKFQASATEQEIWRGALAVPDAPEHVVAWYRTIRNRDQYPHHPRTKDFFDPIEALQVPAVELRNELAQRLHRDGRKDIQPVEVDMQLSPDGEKLEVTRDHLQPMCNEIEARLREIVEEEIRTYWNPLDISGEAAPLNQSGPSEARKLELETQAHQLFGESRASRDGFVGRDAELKAIADYLRDENDRNPLVVHGPSGTGKTALLARAAQIAAEEYRRRVFLRFLGTTPQSSNLNALLTSLCRELRPSEDRANDLPVELRLLQDEFDRLLALATADEPILLFLDALDQLDEADGARQTYWLRTPLPPHVKVVVSCIRDDEGPAELNESYRTFDRRKLLDHAIAVESLTAPDAIRAIDLWLQHDHRRPGRERQLTTQQREAIGARITPDSAPACRRPLYLRILFEECRLWPSWKAVSPDELGEDTAALLKGLFDRLAQPVMHGALLVESALSYIASARRGLSESEILEVLWADLDYKQYLDEVSRKTKHELPPEATRIPIAIWSRLRHDLDPYLAEQSAPGGVVLNFYHRVVGRVVADRFLKDATRRCLRHDRLAKYFQTELQPWWRELDTSPQRAEDTAAQRVPNARRATELPWQLLREADESDPNHKKQAVWDAPVDLLCDFPFVEVKCAAGLVFELQEDYKVLKQSLPEAQAELAEERRWEADNKHWTHEIVAYSAACCDRRRRKDGGETVAEPMPFPSVLRSVPIKPTGELRIDAENRKSNPTRIDRLIAFSQFINVECHNLAMYADQPGFCLQQAYNRVGDGPVGVAATSIVKSPGFRRPALLRRSTYRPRYTSHPALLRTLLGHTSVVETVSIPAGAKLAVSGSSDNDVRVWDIASGRCIRTLTGHTSTVYAVAASLDGKIGASTSLDSTLRIWDLETGESISTIPCWGSKTLALTTDGKRAVLGGFYREECKIWVWDYTGRECIQTPFGHSNEIRCLALSANGRFVLSAAAGLRGHSDYTLCLWDLDVGQLKYDLKGHSGSPKCVAITPNGHLGVSGGEDDHSVRVWDLRRGELLRTLSGHLGPVESIAITADGRYCASVGGTFLSPRWDNAMRIWDLQTGECLKTCWGHNDRITTVALSADGSIAVTGSQDETLRIWDVTNGEGKSESEEERKTEEAIILCAGAGRHALIGSNNSPIQQVDLRRHVSVSGERQNTPYAGITPDGSNVVSNVDGVLLKWDRASGRVLASFGENEPWSERRRFAVTADGRRVVTTDRHKLEVWNSENGERLFSLEGHKPYLNVGLEISDVAVTADGRLAVSASWDCTLRVWDIETGECLHVLEGHSQYVNRVTLIQGGKWILSTSFEESRLWDIRTGQCLKVFPGRSELTTGNGRWVFSWREGSSVELLDIPAGTAVRLQAMNASRGPIGTTVGRDNVIISDSRIIFGDAVGAFGVWSAQGGQRLATAAFEFGVSWIAHSGELISVIDVTGRASLMDIRNVECETPVITLARIYDFARKQWDALPTGQCAWCGRRFTPATDVVGAINGLADECATSSSHSLMSSCPNCGKRVVIARALDFDSQELLRLSIPSHKPSPSCCMGSDIPLKSNRFIVDRQGGEDLSKEVNPHGVHSIRNAPRAFSGGLASAPHPKANPELAAQLNINYSQDLNKWKELPWWRRIRIKKPERPTGI
jgi:WD40 repeat protein